MSKKKMPTYRLYRDGELIMTGTEFQLMRYVHSKHSFSFLHALKYEGYSWEQVLP